MRRYAAVLPFVMACAAACAGQSGGSAAPSGACGLPAPADADFVSTRMNAKRGTRGTAEHAMVASSHARATAIGVDTLRRGGNAVDAFVATVLAEDIVLPGVTSTAGIAGFLVYQAKSKLIVYVHGPLKAPAAMGTGVGGQALVPGAVGALALASKTYGRLPLADVVAPVAALARDGFPIDRLFAKSIERRADMLAKSEYGARTFLRDGKPLAEGDVLAQPEVASTLTSIGSGGSDWFYRGDWASRFVAAVAAAGGRATAADLAGYQALVVSPLSATYRGNTIYASAGYSVGGAKALLALKALEHADLHGLGRFGESGSSLALLARVHDAEASQSWADDPTVLLQAPTANARIVEGGDAIWSMVQSGHVPPPAATAGSHSSAVIAIDAEGNIAAGTHTIEAENWGLGLFVGGLPLATSASLHPDLVPGALLTDPLSTEIVGVDHEPRAVLSTYGTGLHPGDVQVLSHVLDFGADAEDAVLFPRLGPYAYTLDTKADRTVYVADPTKHLLDERVPMSVVCAASASGVALEQKEPAGYSPGIIDTGFPTLVTIDAAPGPKRLAGMTPEWLDGTAAGF